MAKAFILSESDKKVLQDLLTEIRSSRVNKPIVDSTEQDQTSPEVYIALPPSSGIPAMVLTGIGPDIETGTGTTGTATTTIEDSNAEAKGDSPGFANCDLYRIIDGILIATGHKRLVYNLSTTAITQKWISIRRTKFGYWVVDCPCT